MRKYIQLSIVLIVFLAQHAAAQEVLFSQYHLNPMFTNPAYPAVSDFIQVAATYRKQSLESGQGFSVPALAGIYPLYRNYGTERFGGIGATFWQDRTGDGGILVTTGFMTGFAYNQEIFTDQFVAFGIQVGYLNKRVDLGNISTDSQFINGAFDSSADLQEAFANDRASAVTFNAGAIWYGLDDQDNRLFSLGVSAYNLNRPDFSFTAEDNKLSIGYQVHGDIQALNKNNYYIIPTARWAWQAGSQQLNVGALWQYRFGNFYSGAWRESRVGLGTWYDVDNAVVFSLEYAQPEFIVGVSYDLPVGSNSPDGRASNAFEITAIWLKNRNPRNSNYRPFY